MGEHRRASWSLVSSASFGVVIVPRMQSLKTMVRRLCGDNVAWQLSHRQETGLAELATRLDAIKGSAHACGCGFQPRAEPDRAAVGAARRRG